MGYVAWSGTQHNPAVARSDRGIPRGGGATLALIGDLKQMDPRWLVGLSFLGYGVSLMVGVGIPIPLIDAGMAAATAIRDEEIEAPVVDYSRDYPQGTERVLAWVNYRSLRSGEISLEGKKVPTASLSSYARAREIAGILKKWILEGSFTLTEPVAPLPGASPPSHPEKIKIRATDSGTPS